MDVHTHTHAYARESCKEYIPLECAVFSLSFFFFLFFSVTSFYPFSGRPCQCEPVSFLFRFITLGVLRYHEPFLLLLLFFFWVGWLERGGALLLSFEACFCRPTRCWLLTFPSYTCSCFYYYGKLSEFALSQVVLRCDYLYVEEKTGFV